MLVLGDFFLLGAHRGFRGFPLDGDLLAGAAANPFDQFCRTLVECMPLAHELHDFAVLFLGEQIALEEQIRERVHVLVDELPLGNTGRLQRPGWYYRDSEVRARNDGQRTFHRISLLIGRNRSQRPPAYHLLHGEANESCLL